MEEGTGQLSIYINPPNMKTTIEVNNLTKYYGKFRAVGNASFSIFPGEIYGLLGANGAGKSSIIKLMLGLTSFGDDDSGEILINGIRVSQISYPAEIRKIIGYVPEDRTLIEDLTGGEYVDFIARLYSSTSLGYKERKEYYFQLFHLHEREHHLIRFYSNGMKKKALLIGAMIHNPKILIVDEPFAALDPESIYILKQAFTHLSKQGCTILLSSHNLRIIEDICHRFVILNQGKTLYEGDKRQLFVQCRTTNLEDSYIKLIKGSDEIKVINTYIHNLPYPSQSLEE